MASQPPETDDTIDDAEFHQAFAELAGEQPPRQEEKVDDATSEGNDPEDQVAASEQPPAKDPSESVTSDPATAAGDKPAADVATDRWAGLPQETRDAIAELERERDKALHRAASDAQRVAALSRKLAAAGQPAPSSAPADTGKAEEPSEAQKALKAKMEQLKEDFPEVAEPLLEALEAQSEQLTQVTKRVAAYDEQQEQARVAAERARLDELHPDWQDVAQNQDFIGWLEAQPEGIQKLASSYDARETAIVLSTYKAENAMEQRQEAQPQAEATGAGARRAQQLAGGREVRSKPAPAATGVPDEFEAAAAIYQAKKDREIAEGRR